LDNFVKATTKVDGSFAPMSYTEASKLILKKSDDEIILSIQQQYVEKSEAHKINNEENVPNLNTGIFKLIDDKYGNATSDSNVNNNSGGDEFGSSSFNSGGVPSSEFSSDEFGEEGNETNDEFNDNETEI